MIRPFTFFGLLIVLTFTLRHNVNVTWVLTIDKCPSNKKFDGSVYNVTIPSTLHLDLLKHHQIQDPFFSNNYPSVKWISQCQVTYAANLTFPDEIKRHQHIELVFEGIDTYSTITFNNKEIKSTKNAFVEQRIQLNKQNILGGANEIKVAIKSTKIIEDQADRVNRMPFIYAHSRKPCYQYSWDWAPYLNTMGIWKPVYINAYDDIKMNYVWVRNKVITEHEAVINFAISFTVPETQGFVGSDYMIKVQDQNNHHASSTVQSIHTYFDMNISQPELWWPNQIGQPYIYEFKVRLFKDSQLLDEKSIPYGIRTVKLEQKNNEFTVVVNGYPVYCKGANYVPPDMFYPRLTNPDFESANTIENLIDDAVRSHYNMIRIWGGGQYQSNEFLELASRKGIMIFYDFMFSDSIYPSDQKFLENVEEEIKQEIRRVRNYPCLAIWSGNNEILQGIYSWGWGRDNYKKDYHQLFQWLIPEVLKKENPQISYIPSSPVNGVGNSGFTRGGDIHFWGVWAGGSSFEAYKAALGPFNSEFGTQSLPVWETIKQFTNQNERSYSASGFSVHQRHGSQFRTLQKYHRMYAHESKNFQMQAYMSGLVQAYGIQIAIKYQRLAKPKSYGTLYWQMNDAWPSISWSSIDYYGRWKPLQYMAKRLYPNIAIFCVDGTVKAVNDNLYPVDAIAIIKVISFSGETLYEKQMQVRLDINEVKTLQQVETNSFSDKRDQVVVHTQIIAGRNQEMESTFFYFPFKDLKLQKAKLFVRYDFEYNVIIVRTETFIKNLFISNTKQYVKLSDNYFDLIANKEVKVQLLPTHNTQPSLSELKQTMKFRGYQQIHSDEEIKVVLEN